MGSRSYLMQTTTTARSLLHSWSRRCVQGNFTLGALTDQSPNLPLILLATIVEASWQIWEVVGVAACGSGGAASSSGEPSSTGINQQYLVLGNPFQNPELLESMRRHWQQLPNWKSATVETLKDWPGKGRRKRTPGNMLILLASVLTNFYFTSQVKFLLPIHAFRCAICRNGLSTKIIQCKIISQKVKIWSSTQG